MHENIGRKEFEQISSDVLSRYVRDVLIAVDTYVVFSS